VRTKVETRSIDIEKDRSRLIDKQTDKQTEKGRQTAIWRDRRGGQKKRRRKESQGEVVIQSEAKAWVCIGATIFSMITKTQKGE